MGGASRSFRRGDVAGLIIGNVDGRMSRYRELDASKPRYAHVKVSRRNILRHDRAGARGPIGLACAQPFLTRLRSACSMTQNAAAHGLSKLLPSFGERAASSPYCQNDDDTTQHYGTTTIHAARLHTTAGDTARLLTMLAIEHARMPAAIDAENDHDINAEADIVTLTPPPTF